MKITKLSAKVKSVELLWDELLVNNNCDAEHLDQHSEFLIGSVTKVFTAVLVLILRDRKTINLNAPISRYIPATKNNDFTRATIWDMLNHISGIKENFYIPNHPLFVGSSPEYKSATEETEPILQHDIKLFTGWHGTYLYSNAAYDLLGRIIEICSGTTYQAALERFILKPLKMRSTGIGRTNTTLYGRGGKELTREGYIERYQVYGSGCLYSSIDDLIKFANFTRLLSDRSLKDLESLYFFNEKTGALMHTGYINGGQSSITVTYSETWKPAKIHIRLDTCRGYSLDD